MGEPTREGLKSAFDAGRELIVFAGEEEYKYDTFEKWQSAASGNQDTTNDRGSDQYANPADSSPEPECNCHTHPVVCPFHGFQKVSDDSKQCQHGATLGTFCAICRSGTAGDDSVLWPKGATPCSACSEPAVIDLDGVQHCLCCGASADQRPTEACTHPSCNGKGICNKCGESVPNPEDYCSGGGL